MSHPLASSSVSQSFQNLLYTVVCSIPKILVFLTVLVIGWISKVLAWIVDMILRRVKFDHFVERGFAGRPLARSKIVAMTLITKIVYYSILLVTLQMAFGVFGPNPISAMLGGVVAWLPGAIVAIVIFLIAPAITKVVKALLDHGIGIDTSVFKYGRRNSLVTFDYSSAHSNLVPWRASKLAAYTRSWSGSS